MIAQNVLNGCMWLSNMSKLDKVDGTLDGRLSPCV